MTQAGPNWSRVRAITDDDSNVSAMISTTSDTCIIAGNLQLIDEGTLSLVKLTDDNNHVHVGDKVVTSNISEKYLPGILIGYISELNNDANNLTKSGTVNPAVDFRHLQEVLVIRTRKEYIPSEGEVPESVRGSSDTTTLTAPRAENTGAGTEDDTHKSPEDASPDGEGQEAASSPDGGGQEAASSPDGGGQEAASSPDGGGQEMASSQNDEGQASSQEDAGQAQEGEGQ